MKTTSQETAQGPLILLGGMGLQPGFVPAWKEVLALLPVAASRMVIHLVASTEHKPTLDQRVTLAKEIFSSLGMTTQTIGGHTMHPPTLSEASTIFRETDCAFVMLDESFTSSLSSLQMQPEKNIALDLWDVMWTRHSAGMAVIASASVAVTLGEHTFAPIKPYPPTLEALGFDLSPGIGMFPGAAILPYFDRFPSGLLDKLERLFPPETTLIGIDEQAALVRGHAGWQAAGLGDVSILIDNEVVLVAEPGESIPDHLLDK